jgi:hypothetical protein
MATEVTFPPSKRPTASRPPTRETQTPVEYAPFPSGRWVLAKDDVDTDLMPQPAAVFYCVGEKCGLSRTTDDDLLEYLATIG